MGWSQPRDTALAHSEWAESASQLSAENKFFLVGTLWACPVDRAADARAPVWAVTFSHIVNERVCSHQCYSSHLGLVLC